MSIPMIVMRRPFNVVGLSRSNIILSQRLIHTGFVCDLPTGQHMAADGEELKSERDKHMKSGKKTWNEKLATHSEAGIRAEKDTRNTAALQKDTIKDSHGSN